MAARARVTGGDKLLRFLKDMPKQATAEVRATIRREAEALVEEVRAAAPEDTGALRRAIRARYSQRGLVARVGIFAAKAAQKAAGAVGLMRLHGLSKRAAGRATSQLARDPYYARFVEFGTRHAPAQPFLFPTFRRKRRAIRSAIVKAVTDTLKKGAR